MTGSRNGVTLLELLLAMAIALPMLAVAWNAFVGARHAEDATALAAAVRGAAVLERWFRQDFASLDLSRGVDDDGWPGAVVPVTGAAPSLTIQQVLPGANPFAVPASVRYSFAGSDTDGWTVERNGRRLSAVVLAEPPRLTTVTTNRGRRRTWCAVAFRTLDPGRRRLPNGGLVGFTANLLVPIPLTHEHDSNVDYTRPVTTQ